MTKGRSSASCSPTSSKESATMMIRLVFATGPGPRGAPLSALPGVRLRVKKPASPEKRAAAGSHL
jgi:hypothetical protein